MFGKEADWLHVPRCSLQVQPAVARAGLSTTCHSEWGSSWEGGRAQAGQASPWSPAQGQEGLCEPAHSPAPAGASTSPLSSEAASEGNSSSYDVWRGDWHRRLSRGSEIFVSL